MYPLEAMGIRKARKKLIPITEGRVLELGAGTGANLRLYDFRKVEELIVTDKERSKHLVLSNFDYVKYLDLIHHIHKLLFRI